MIISFKPARFKQGFLKIGKHKLNRRSEFDECVLKFSAGKNFIFFKVFVAIFGGFCVRFIYPFLSLLIKTFFFIY